MMNREQAIENYVNQMNGVELRDLVTDLSVNEGAFSDLEWFDMCNFDDYMEGRTPTEIADMIFFGDFNPNHDYFRFNGYGNLESADIYGVEEDIRGWSGDIVDYLQGTHYTSTWDSTLKALVEADDDTMFDEDYEEVEEDEEE